MVLHAPKTLTDYYYFPLELLQLLEIFSTDDYFEVEVSINSFYFLCVLINCFNFSCNHFILCLKELNSNWSLFFRFSLRHANHLVEFVPLELIPDTLLTRLESNVVCGLSSLDFRVDVSASYPFQMIVHYFCSHGQHANESFQLYSTIRPDFLGLFCYRCYHCALSFLKQDCSLLDRLQVLPCYSLLLAMKCFYALPENSFILCDFQSILRRRFKDSISPPQSTKVCRCLTGYLT